MNDRPELLTAAELDSLTPDQRAAALRARVVVDFDILPEDFRIKIIETATALAARLGSNQTE